MAPSFSAAWGQSCPRCLPGHREGSLGFGAVTATTSGPRLDERSGGRVAPGVRGPVAVMGADGHRCVCGWPAVGRECSARALVLCSLLLQQPGRGPGRPSVGMWGWGPCPSPAPMGAPSCDPPPPVLPHPGFSSPFSEALPAADPGDPGPMKCLSCDFPPRLHPRGPQASGSLAPQRVLPRHRGCSHRIPSAAQPVPASTRSAAAPSARTHPQGTASLSSSCFPCPNSFFFCEVEEIVGNAASAPGEQTRRS